MFYSGKISVHIAIPKKVGTVECDQHHTISLMSHLTKVMLRLLMNRMKSNEEVMEMAGYKRSLLKTTRKRQLQFFGYINRADGLEKQTLS